MGDLLIVLSESYTIGFGIAAATIWRARQRFKDPDSRANAAQFAVLLTGIALAGFLRIAANSIEGQVRPFYTNPVSNHLYTTSRVVIFCAAAWYLLHHFGILGSRPRDDD